MRDILLTVVTWIHLLSAVVWIGGIFFILFVALPTAKETLEQPGKLMGAIGKRFVPMANISILLIFLTGIFMGLSTHKVTNFSNLWPQTLFVKVLIALVMTGIHFYRGLVLAPKIGRLTAEGGHFEQAEKLQKLSLNLVKTNLVIGVTVLFLTAILYNTHRI